LPPASGQSVVVPEQLRQSFINDIHNVVGMLHSIEAVAEVDSDEKATRSVQLITFLQSIGERSEYLRQIQLLADFHARCKHMIQAGQTLLLHANALEWDDTIMMDPLLQWPRQSMAHRKELVVKQALEYFQAVRQRWHKATFFFKKI
jgi:hypothetical protein